MRRQRWSAVRAATAATFALTGLTTHVSAQAVRAPAAPASSASAPAATQQLDRVEITSKRASDTDERRASTAAKIVIGRDEIDRYGDGNLGDVLKRLPGVTMQGRPGRGGAIRMRGLGSGYTQILLDGQRVPPGFSLDSLTPEQVERIEILRAPTAETGARAIAGTINIITREGFNKRINDLRLIAGLENDRLQPSVAWTRNEAIGPFIVNTTLSAFSQDRQSGSTTTTLARGLDDDALLLDQTDVGSVHEKRRGLHATGRLQWRGEQGFDTVTLMPLLIHGEGTTDRRGVLVQRVNLLPVTPFSLLPYDSAATAGEGSFSLTRLNGQWNHRFDTGGRLETKFGLGQGRSVSATLREETTNGAISRTLDDRSDIVDRNLLLASKFTRALENSHTIVTGLEGESNRRSEQRSNLQNGAPLLADFGDNVSASSLRFAAFAQDEWSLTPQWAVHAGLRWEGITTRGSGESDTATNRSSVWTPLMHAVWKPEPESRDQVRFSLTRSYRSPTLQNLIARPRINPRAPAPGANSQTQPDYAGNPALRPELATGIDIAVERYLAGGGLLSANVFRRQIRNYLRSQIGFEDVSWSPGQPRWVSRPQNIGDAVTQGIELEAKFRLSDVLGEAMPSIDVRANASVFTSRVKSVPGPDNRLDQQPDLTANLGADYRVPGLPLTIGGSLNWTPAYDTRVSALQTAYQGRKLIADAYALWIFSPTLQLRITASNLNPREYATGSGVDDLDTRTRETAMTSAPTYLNLQLRLEMKL